MNKKVKEAIAASYLGLSQFTLQKWRRTGKGPPYYKLGGRVIYAQNDLDAFLEDNKFHNTSEPK